MIEIIAVIAVLTGVTLLGRNLLGRNVERLEERKRFAGEYLNRLGRYLDSDGTDGEAYAWLTHRAGKIQNEMGGYGVMKHFRPPFANFMYNDYPVVLNMLPEVRSHIGDPVMGNLVGQYANTLQESFLRYIGALDDALEDGRAELKNPLVAFRQGVQSVLLLPKYLLHWLGLTSKPSLYSRGPLMRLASGLVSLVGLLAAIMTIIVGWEEFVRIVVDAISVQRWRPRGG